MMTGVRGEIWTSPGCVRFANGPGSWCCRRERIGSKKQL